MKNAFILKSRGKDMVGVEDYKDETTRGKKVILYKHGFMGHKITSHRKIVNTAHMLVDLGYTVIRFDCVGAGDSEGDYHYVTFGGELEDTLVVIDHIKKNIKPEKFIILGYSMGGMITSLVSDKVETDGIVLWSPVADPFYNFYYLIGEDAFINGLKGNDVSFAGDRIGKEFFVGMKDPKYQPIEHIRNYKNPVRIIHGTKDEMIPFVNSLAYCEVLPDVKLHAVNGADHEYNDIHNQDELYKVTVDFVKEIMEK